MIVISYMEKLKSLGFPLGSRVILTGEDPGHVIKAGDVGVVCHYTRAWEEVDGCNIGVEWETESHQKHDCKGHCKNKYGRYVPHTELSLLSMDLGSFETSDFDFDFLLGVNT